jgi:hypothetical protein
MDYMPIHRSFLREQGVPFWCESPSCLVRGIRNSKSWWHQMLTEKATIRVLASSVACSSKPISVSGPLGS